MSGRRVWWPMMWVFCAMFLVPGVAAAEESWPVDGDEGEAGEESAWDGWDRLGVEEATTLSRAELVTFQTIHGAVLGGQACGLLDCRSPRAFVGLPALGGLTGLGASLYLTRDVIAPGMTSAINSGVLAGGWSGLWFAELMGWRNTGPLGSMMVGQMVGMGAGYGLATALRPTAGDVAAVNHSAFWTTVSYLLVTQVVLDLRVSAQTTAATFLVVPAVGAIGGGVLASNYPMARPRVRVVSSAGFAGGLLGLAIPFLIFEDSLSPRVGGATVLTGIFAGLGVGGYFTRNWDEEYREGLEASVSVGPTMDGEGMQLSVSGRF